MKFMKPIMVVFLILILICFSVACAQVFFHWEWPAQSNTLQVVMIVLFCIFILITIIGLVGQRFDIKKIGFYALHIGLVLFLIGSMVYRITGDYVSMSMPINEVALYNTIEREDGSVLKLGFEFGVSKLVVTKYEPVYDVYKKVGEGTKVVKHDVSLSNDGYYDFGEYGKIKLQDLMIGSNQIKEQFELAQGIMAVVRMPVKTYDATFVTKIDGVEKTQSLKINSPIRIKGYKIYLMSYNATLKSVTLTFKKDLGEPLSTSGLIMCMLGTLYHCLAYPVLIKRQQAALLNKGVAK